MVWKDVKQAVVVVVVVRETKAEDVNRSEVGAPKSLTVCLR